MRVGSPILNVEEIMLRKRQKGNTIFSGVPPVMVNLRKHQLATAWVALPQGR